MKLLAKMTWTNVLLLLLGSAAARAQTTGIITTRPTCVPPNGTQLAVNYIQGPDPILLPNGDVAILVNAGKCCDGPWEGIFSLIYPAAGRPAAPRFSGLWASNNWNTEPRNEHEVGYPSAIFYGNQWRIAYTATFGPSHWVNRDRLGRLDTDNLTYRALTSQVTNQWILPTKSNCRPLNTCPAQEGLQEGSGVLGTFVLHPNNDLYVYHPDGNSGCQSRWLRHKINPDMSVANLSGNGCITLNGRFAAPTWLSDIGRGADGKLYMLTNADNYWSIEEWVSEGDATTIGLVWNRTGRQWNRPAYPSPNPNNFSYLVWDAGYLKDRKRQIVEPKVVVSQISSGKDPTPQDIFNSALGRWYLHYWADANAVLPPSFGGHASSCAFGGWHEVADCTSVSGWAWDPAFPNSPISVDIYDGSTMIDTAAANLYRGDLIPYGIGDGVHGFVWPVPASLKNNLAHSITVKYSGTQTPLPASPKSITCAPSTTHTLTVNRTGTGSGTVTSSPAGINCGVDCAEPYVAGTPVTLNPAPAPGSTFASWGGHSDCADGSVTMNAALTCTATFNTIVTPANLALGKPTTQSSNYNGSTAHGSQDAADGNNDGNYFNGSVTHTGLDAQAWWQVDLGSVSALQQINVWNRTDCCPERLSNFYVLVSAAPFTSTNLWTTMAQPGVSYYHVPGTAGRPSTVSVGLSGRYVRVQLAGTNYLSIAEVEVLGQPGTPPAETVWVEDSLPSGATPLAEYGDGWTWIDSTVSPGPYSGSRAHQSNIFSGMHQHYFQGATQTLTVNPGDMLFAYVYLDPANMPSQVMLQWNDGSWDHRAYWGENQITFGIDNTNSRRHIGPLPGPGWQKLQVSASQVGLESRTLNGMAFTLFGGRATWDRAGKSP